MDRWRKKMAVAFATVIVALEVKSRCRCTSDSGEVRGADTQVKRAFSGDPLRAEKAAGWRAGFCSCSGASSHHRTLANSCREIEEGFQCGKGWVRLPATTCPTPHSCVRERCQRPSEKPWQVQNGGKALQRSWTLQGGAWADERCVMSVGRWQTHKTDPHPHPMKKPASRKYVSGMENVVLRKKNRAPPFFWRNADIALDVKT